jgi:8-oxo-dGTP diphosphatase
VIVDARPTRTRLAAYAVSLDAGGRLLVCRIASGDPGEGSWTLPGGGLEFGEHPAACVVRELAEETGLVGEIASLAGIDSLVYPSTVTHDGAEVHAIWFVYRVHVVGGDLRDEVDGSSDVCAWVTRDELAVLPTVPVLDRSLPLVFGG